MGLKAQPASYSRNLSRGKAPRLEIDQSPKPSGEFKNEWSCASDPPVCLSGVGRNRFTIINIKVLTCIDFLFNVLSKELIM